MTRIDPDLITAVEDINRAFYTNGDWFPDNAPKLLKFIHAYEKALAIRPAMASHGGSAAEELRFSQDVVQSELQELKATYLRLTRTRRGVGGFRQNQLTRGGERW